MLAKSASTQAAVMRAMYIGLGVATVVMLGLVFLTNALTEIPAQDSTGQALGAIPA